MTIIKINRHSNNHGLREAEIANPAKRATQLIASARNLVQLEMKTKVAAVVVFDLFICVNITKYRLTVCKKGVKR